MKGFYYLLVQLSLNELVHLSSKNSILGYLDIEINRCGFEKKFEDIGDLVEFLFKKLGKNFKRFLKDLDDVSACGTLENASRDALLWSNVDELAFLLRSCMVILTMVALDPNLVMEKVRVLLSILERLISFSTSEESEKNSVCLKKSFSHKCKISDAGSTTYISEDFVASVCFVEPSDPCCPFLCSLLEVFADELLMHRKLREYFMLVNSASSTSQMSFLLHLAQGDMGSVLDVISAHFILSYTSEQAYRSFLKRLFWGWTDNFRVPEMSPVAAMSLLLNPIILSAPKLFQVHLILLVSEAIGVCIFSKNKRPDHKLMDCYLTAFERSIKLYTTHMSCLHEDFNPIISNTSFVNTSMLGSNRQPGFDSYIQGTKKVKFDNLISRSDKFWTSYLFSSVKSDLLASSIAYLEESQCVLDKSYKHDMFSILHSIILGAFHDCTNIGTEIYRNGDTSPHDIYLLASVLKLMCSSMLPAIWCLRHSEKIDGMKTLKDVSSCKEYDFISSILSCFREFNVCLPNQLYISDVLRTRPMKHRNSKWMLVHFSGLLSLSFASGIDFLVKECIFAMISLLNLFIFEEGDLSAFSSLLSFRMEQPLSSDKLEGAMPARKSSTKVACEFQKIQTLRSSLDSYTGFHQKMQDLSRETTEEDALDFNGAKESSSVGIEEETCSGEIFLKCLLDGTGGGASSDSYDDISDFIEVKRGKDYIGWLKNRKRYQKWKSQKLAVLKWRKKKKTWKFMKGKKT